MPPQLVVRTVLKESMTRVEQMAMNAFIACLDWWKRLHKGCIHTGSVCFCWVRGLTQTGDKLK